MVREIRSLLFLSYIAFQARILIAEWMNAKKEVLCANRKKKIS